MAIRFHQNGRLDSAAFVLSILCLVHCIAGLTLLAGMASLGGILLSHGVHAWGLGLASVLAALALGHGAMRHGNLLPVAIGSTGIGVLAGALQLHGTHETFFTMIGVTMVAAAHLINFRLSSNLHSDDLLAA